MMKAKIKQDLYEFRVKIGGKYVVPGRGFYEGRMYKKVNIPKIIEEIEQEFPRYKGKVKAFQVILEEV